MYGLMMYKDMPMHGLHGDEDTDGLPLDDTCLDGPPLQHLAYDAQLMIHDDVPMTLASTS
jgi:hypothetical protein